MIPITLNLKNKKVVHIPVCSNINIVREIKKTSSDKDRWIKIVKARLYNYMCSLFKQWSCFIKEPKTDIHVW